MEKTTGHAVGIRPISWHRILGHHFLMRAAIWYMQQLDHDCYPTWHERSPWGRGADQIVRLEHIVAHVLHQICMKTHCFYALV